MERFLLYLDDLDDLFSTVASMRERLRNLLLSVLLMALLITVVALASGLAFVHPPIALATLTLLVVALGYRSVTRKPA